MKLCPCYSPLKGFQIGIWPESGKPKYKIVSYNTDHIELHKVHGNDFWYSCQDSFVSPYALKIVKDFTVVKCNQCIGCRLDYSRQWADRCMAENTLHEESQWLTLTYDDEHLPRSDVVDEDGVIHTTATLVKKDFQDFMKRLRMAYNRKYGDKANKLRHFTCGEYGSKRGRPHYHSIVFGLHLDDLVIEKRTAPDKGGFLLYRSEFIEKLWGKGRCIVAEVNWQTCAYTARYMLKKQKGDSAFIYDLLQIQPEFTLQSNKPGIARDFYEQHKDDYKMYHEINLPTSSGGKKIRNVSYFDKIFAIEDEIEYNLYKEEKQKAAEDIVAFKLAHSDLSYPELLEIEARNVKERIKSLKREL